MDNLQQFVSAQLAAWPKADAAYTALRETVLTRSLRIDGMEIRLQHNPARAASTGAKVDAASLAARPCFLCASNRPVEQSSLAFSGAGRDYEVLVNPFPIAPLHLTIASARHEHQDNFQAADMARFAWQYPGWTAFYNGSSAGASAPDHLHFQAVETSFFDNLAAALASGDAQLLARRGDWSARYLDLPMQTVHITEPEFSPLTEKWIERLLPADSESALPRPGARNLFMYRDEAGLHTLIMLRAAHRPDCYFATGESRIMCSPGAIDMAGTLILPRREDFDKITAAQVRRIYSQVSLDPRPLPGLKALLLA